MITSTAPDRTEAAEYYFTYINQVPAGNIVDTLEAQAAEYVALLESVSEEQSLFRYESGKWSIREVAAHINDTERVFTYRALWFAREFDSPLPSYDQNIAMATCGADARALSSHIEEFRAIRSSTLALFRNMPAEAWPRRGTASGNPFTVRALAFIAAGHVNHHAKILRERYLMAAAATS
jgi:hypothetical protein